LGQHIGPTLFTIGVGAIVAIDAIAGDWISVRIFVTGGGCKLAARRRAAFSASSPLFDLNGATTKARNKHNSPIILPA
jgi:hypothetical protein